MWYYQHNMKKVIWFILAFLVFAVVDYGLTLVFGLFPKGGFLEDIGNIIALVGGILSGIKVYKANTKPETPPST